MRIFLSFVGWLFITWVIACFLDTFHLLRGDGPIYGSIVVTAMIFFGNRYRKKQKMEGKVLTDSIAEGAQAIKSFKSAVNVKMERGENELFAIAEAEVNSGQQDKGLWSKALIKAGGDESRRKIEYMKLRARQ